MIRIAVGVGGALGSMSRHGVNHLVHTHWLATRFPIGTMVVNVVGCFVGLLTALITSERVGLRVYCLRRNFAHRFFCAREIAALALEDSARRFWLVRGAAGLAAPPNSRVEIACLTPSSWRASSASALRKLRTRVLKAGIVFSRAYAIRRA